MFQKKRRILAHRPGGNLRPSSFWVAAGASAFSLFGMVAAFAVVPATRAITVSQQTLVEQLALPAVQVGGGPAEFVGEELIRPGDTIAGLVQRLGVSDPQALRFLQSDSEAGNLARSMRAGRPITAVTTDSGELIELSYPLPGKETALIVRRADEGFSASEQPLKLEDRVLMTSGEIRSSLFAAADESGLPDAVAVQMAEIFAADIDFHTDLRRGDRFSVVYEMRYHRGEPIRAGRILAAEFVNSGKTYRALWHQGGGYYTPDGKSLRKAFLRSPLEFSRVTSGFSMRFHPVLQRMRAHKGVDYGAPIGTRVRATADGVVEFVGRQGGYGNLVVLRHQGRYTTYYGHLNGFAPGLRRGSRVSQGETVGYVGRTGVATGPHLHYEFRINNVHQNPLSVALPTAVPLSPAELARFREAAPAMLSRLDMLAGIQLAKAAP